MITRRRSSFLAGTVLLALGLGGHGCVGYRLGSMVPPDIRSVYVPTFVNQTGEPLLEIETTRAAIQEFQKDGSLKVAPEDEADAILRIKLTEYQLTPLAYNSVRKTEANEYRLTIYASLVLTRRRDNTVITESPRVRGEATFEIIGDLSTSKRAGLPPAAADLAHSIVQRVTEMW